ncbi:LysR family transcriptional regulator [Agrobacterium vitis]|uniref:LysR family transcriptional regulator n=1 Tax=Agrobacterium vitis TaxID=373 RepID=UPI000760EC2C|nr:LysR family transcriptional regulator [Agrobacterium vitis]KAA3517786.1 LysR family transcriptional regulator [Agrobacterium vitis]NOJ33070.1 LysR family transcriptional regulator [Agrobacterium vitis]RCU53374.1 LysR family transcriptional regulator [Agrobacterium vitis]
MELRHLRYVVATARNGSFSAAGNELNVHQPIISKRIRELEDELGVPLFDRSTAGARLTPVGEEFAVSARRIIEDIEQLRDRAKASGSGRLGRVVVGFYKSLSSGALRAALRDFRSQYSDIEVELIETPFIDVAAGVLSGAIDAAVVLGDVVRGEAFDFVPLWSENLVVALPQDHPLVERSVIYWPDLKGERFLISYHDPGPDIHAILLRHLAAPSDHPDIITRRLSRESILSEVASGQGIALQSESAVGLSSLGVVFRPLHSGSGATRLGYMAYWKPDNQNPALKTFIDTIKRQS